MSAEAVASLPPPEVAKMIKVKTVLCGAAAVMVLVTSHGLAQQPSEQQSGIEALLNKTTAWVLQLEQDLSGVVAEERYEQQSFGQSTRKQTTLSDFLLVRLPSRDDWVPFRDVFEVDGRKVRDRTDRLQRLFVERPQNAMNEAAKIANESSRYNIGPIARTINVPTFALMLLRPNYRQRFEFKQRPQAETVNGQALTRVNFRERTRPTVARSNRGDDAPLDGFLVIDADTGHVRGALVKTVGTPEPGNRSFSGSPPVTTTQMWVAVSYAANDALGLWVPVDMTEYGWTSAGGLFGRATYSNFRRFRVNTSETFKDVKVP